MCYFLRSKLGAAKRRCSLEHAPSFELWRGGDKAIHGRAVRQFTLKRQDFSWSQRALAFLFDTRSLFVEFDAERYHATHVLIVPTNEREVAISRGFLS